MGAAVFFYNAIDRNGSPVSGAKANFYVKGTTTRQAAYTDIDLTTPAANPVVADSAGRVRVYIDDTLNYSIDVKNSDQSETLLQADYTSGDTDPMVITMGNPVSISGLNDAIADAENVVTEAQAAQEAAAASAATAVAAETATDDNVLLTGADVVQTGNDRAAIEGSAREIEAAFVGTYEGPHINGIATGVYDASGNVESGKTVFGFVITSDNFAEASDLSQITSEVRGEQAINFRGPHINGIAAGLYDAAGNVTQASTVFGFTIGYGGQDSTGVVAPSSGQFKDGQTNSGFSGLSRQHVFRLDAIEGTPGDTAHQWRQLSFGPYDTQFVSESTAGDVNVTRNGLTKVVKYRTSGLLGGLDKIIHIIILGQSLSLGWKDTGTPSSNFPVPILNNADPVAPLQEGLRGAAMFAPAGGPDSGPRPLQQLPVPGAKNVALDTDRLATLVSLREMTHLGDDTFFETCASPIAAELLGGHLAQNTIVLVSVIGTGSTSISEFEKGSVTGAQFANAMACVTAAKTFADLWGRDLESHVVYCQGEQDNTDGTTIAAYKTALTGIASDFDTDITAITSQSDFHFIVQQTSQAPSGTNELGDAGKAQAELMIAGTVAGVPSYPMLPGGASTHIWPSTYMPWGTATGYELAQLMDAPTRKPTHAVFASKAGAVATFTLSGGSGAGYQFDTDTIPNAPDGAYGFTATDDNGAMTVSSMAISGTTLTVTFDASIVGTLNWKFGIDNYQSGVTAKLPNTNAPRVNIRDGSDIQCRMTGQFNTGWMIQHEGSN